MDNSRRQLLKKTLGLSALLVSAKAVDAATCGITAPQTPGPFVPDDFPFREQNEGAPYLKIADSNTDLTVVDGGQGVPRGQVLVVRGQVVDQNCDAVAGANVYLWQADDSGHYNHAEDPNVRSIEDLDPSFQYRGIAVTDAEGRFSFKTIKPKYYPLDEQGTVMRTAHLHVTVLHPKCDQLTTQTYFEGDVLEDIERIRELNAQDIILAPRGTIRDELKNLIIDFKLDRGGTVPVGDVQLTVRRRQA